MIKLRVKKIGDGLGLILPEEILDRFQLADGDRIWVREDGDGVHLTLHMSRGKGQLETARRLMTRRRRVLRKLAG